MSFFNITLSLSLTICIIGIIYRMRGWFHLLPRQKSTIFAAWQSYGETLFNRPETLLKNIFGWTKSILLDTLLQWHVFKQSPVRWIMHFSIFAGFIFLVFMHAMDDIITQPLFPDYAPTLNPFRFLRNFFGLLVLTGIGIAAYRRVANAVMRKTGKLSDWTLLILIFAIIGSGFLLESVQIISPAMFDEMVWDYAMTEDEQEINALKAYWETYFSVAFAPGDAPLPSPALLAEGESLHEDSCAACHSRPESAFISHPIAKTVRPAARLLQFLHMETVLWYLHVLLCFAGLALLPFSKLFHMIATPVSIAARSTLPASVEKMSIALSAETNTEQPVASIPGLAWDACTHCTVCSLHCSVAPIFEVMGNTAILPSEKLRMLNRLESDADISGAEIQQLAEGSFICTECNRCTALCPSGINLQAVWMLSKNQIKEQGLLTLHTRMKQKRADEWEDIFTKIPPKPPVFARRTSLTDKPGTFRACVQCTTCTSVCPVAAGSDDPENELDFTPQQIMNLMRLQLRDLALGARMIWQCTTCYKCQEHCPQGIPVTDIMYELKNMAADRLPSVEKEKIGNDAVQAGTVRAIPKTPKETRS